MEISQLLSSTTTLFFFLPSLLLFVFLFTRRPSSGIRLPPGPKGWPILGNLPQLGAKPHQTLASLARNYGPIFHLRLGSVHVVVAASASVAAQFLKTHDVNFSSRPPNSGAEHIAYNYQDMVFAPYGPRWRMLRKLCFVHLFSAKALEVFRHVREEEVSRLVVRLKESGDRTVNLGEEVNVCATDALGRAIMGKRVFGEVGKGAGEFKDMVLEVMKLAGVFNVGDFVPSIAWMDLQGVVGKMKNLHKRYDLFLDNLIDENKNREGKGEDLLSVMLELKKNDVDIDGEGGRVTDVDIKALLLVPRIPLKSHLTVS